MIFNNPYDLVENIEAARWYEQQGQYASALTFYMRAAEYGVDVSDKREVLECLIRAGECLFKLGSRLHAVKSLALQGLRLCPFQPEAYWFLSRVHEAEQEWLECNVISSLGLEFIENKSDFKYDNKDKEELKNELLFQQAISEYHKGGTDMAKLYLADLGRVPNLPKWMDEAIDKSMKAVGLPTRYKQWFLDHNKTSYSQCGQDVAASLITPFRGFYLEIGSSDPIKENNTYLLEKRGWKGVSIDLNKGMVNKFNSTRSNKAICVDATVADYKELLKDAPKVIDYLQIDCDPPDVSFEVLRRIPFDEYKFKFITYEHDAYVDPKWRLKSRTLFAAAGYELLVADVRYNEKEPFEDWWIHPSYVTEKVDINRNFSSPIDIFRK